MTLVWKFETKIARHEVMTALTMTSTMMMVASSSEISMHICQSTRRYITHYGYLLWRNL